MASPRRAAELRTRGWDGSALVRRVAGGEESAFATLRDTTRGLVFGLLLHILGNSAAAEEALADVYEEVREQSATYDNNREALLTWLIMIAYRRATARLETGRQDRRRAGSPEMAGPASAIKHKVGERTFEWERLVCSALDALSPAQRQMVELEYFYGLSHNDIAARLGLPLLSVQAGIQDALTKLRVLPQTHQLYPK